MYEISTNESLIMKQIENIVAKGEIAYVYPLC